MVLVDTCRGPAPRPGAQPVGDTSSRTLSARSQPGRGRVGLGDGERGAQADVVSLEAAPAFLHSQHRRM